MGSNSSEIPKPDGAKGFALEIPRRGTGVSPVLPKARMAVPQTRTKFTFWRS
jgi:hypothetical protein